MSNVFNWERGVSDYQTPDLFFGPKVGLFDTINRHHPKIWSLYKEMKSLDWDENEFDYSQCNIDFKTCDPSVSDMMIKTLIWQWEADSEASRAVAPVLAPFITSSELWAAWQRISDNEVIHAATYSEIVRMSFDNPHEVLQEILAVKETMSRLRTIESALSDLAEYSHKYAIGLASKEESYDYLFKGICALYMLERIQFMASFAITFTICGQGLFQPIGKAVQKIAQDELEVHCELDREVLNIELSTLRGKEAYSRCKPEIEKMFNEVIALEFEWLDYIFSEGKTLLGTNKEILKQWVLYNAKEVGKLLDIGSDHKYPKTNPMPHLDSWLNMNKVQSAPQEQDVGAYKVGIVKTDDEGIIFDTDF